MTVPEIPQDVVNMIIQTFAKIILFDKKQLRKLSLVSHAFVSQSQRCIFDTISLLRDGYRNPNPPYRPFGEHIHILGRKLYALLRTSPHLFSYIRVLKIHAWSSAELAWVASMGSEAAAIIRACSALQSLELGSQAPIEWPMMHPSLQSSLISHIQSIQFNDLTLINVHCIPRFLVSAFGSLGSLCFENVSFSIAEQRNSSRSGRIVRHRSLLKRICIAGSNPSIRLLLDEQVLSSELITMDIGYGYDGEDRFLMHDLLHKVHGVQELHIILLQNALEGLKHITVNPLQNLRRISILTRPGILRETYSFLKDVIRTSDTLEIADIILPGIPHDDWWEWTCLDALHLWADLYFKPSFQQLSLSFVVPETRFSSNDHFPMYDGETGFERKLSTIIGPHGNQQLLSRIIQQQLLVNYVFVYDDILWEESLNIRRRVIDNSIGRVYWHTWDPFNSTHL